MFENTTTINTNTTIFMGTTKYNVQYITLSPHW